MDDIKGTHIYYRHKVENKFTHYEDLWKRAALKLLNKHTDPAQREKWKVLDVGSGRGEMLQLLTKEGYSAEGCDFDPECVKASSRFGYCKQVNITELLEHYSAGQFNTIVALHVLEHTESPKIVIDTFKKLSNTNVILAVPNLSSLALLNWSRNISTCNLGHHCGWNYSHLNNFLSNICNLKVLEWGIDCVRLYDYLPHLQWVDEFFHKTGIRRFFEEGLLTRLFPRLSNSLIVLCATT